MLTSKCVWAYREQFDTKKCVFAEPSSHIMVLNPDTGKYYISPYNETEEECMDRLERSKRENRNLFFEEWDEFIMIPGVLY